MNNGMHDLFYFTVERNIFSTKICLENHKILEMKPEVGRHLKKDLCVGDEASATILC